MEVTTLRGDALNQHAKKVFRGLMRAYGVIISMATLFYGVLFLFDYVLSIVLGEELPFPGEIFIIFGLGLLALGSILVIYIFFINKTIFNKIQEGQAQMQPSQNPYERYQSNIPLPSRSVTESIVDKLDLPTVPALIILFIITLIASSLMALFGGLVTIAALPIIFMCITSPCLMWVSYAYSKDIYEPEPARSILLALGWGMMSCIPSLIMNTTVSAATGGDMFITAAIGAPLIEEFWKPIGLYFVRKDIDDELDGTIYGMSCGMGFAMLENFHYASRSLIVSFYNPGTASGYGMLVVLRSVTSIIGHMVGPACIGYGYAVYLQRKNSSMGLNSVGVQGSGQQSISQGAAVTQSIGFLTTFAILRIPLGYGTGVLFHFIWNGTLTVMSTAGTSGNVCGLCFGMILFMFGFPILEFILLRYLMHLGMKKNIEKYSEKAKDKLPPSILRSIQNLIMGDKTKGTAQPPLQPYQSIYPNAFSSQYPQIYSGQYPSQTYPSQAYSAQPYMSQPYVPPPPPPEYANYASPQYPPIYIQPYAPSQYLYYPPPPPPPPPSSQAQQYSTTPAKYDNPYLKK